MAFSLIDETEGAVPIAALTKTEFPAWLDKAPERERNWLTSIGFSAEAGKHALVPGESGRLARVLVGLGDGADAEGRMWALAGLPAVLPEASYRLDSVSARSRPDDTSRSAGRSRPMSLRATARKPRPAATLVWPEDADRGRVERLAAAVFLARDLANTPAGDLGPEELAGRSGARRQGRRRPSSGHRRRRPARRELPDHPRGRPRQRARPAACRHRLGRSGGAEGDPGRQGGVLRQLAGST